MIILHMAKYVPLVILGLIFLVGCSDSKERLQGERTRLLDTPHVLQPDPDAANVSIELTTPEEVKEWTQPDSNPTHVMPHASMTRSEWAAAWNRSIGSGSSTAGFILVTPVVSNNLIYALDSQGTVTAFDALLGDKKWSYRIKTSTNEGCLGGGIAVEGGRLFASFSSSDVVALNAEDGTLLWQSHIGYAIRSPVTVKNNQLYVVTKNNQVVSLDVETGHLLWYREASEGVCSFLGGGAVAVDRRTVIVPFSSGEVMAMKSENGHSLWSEALTPHKNTRSLAFLSQIKASPVVDHDMVFVTSPNGRLLGLEFRTGTIVWDKPIGSFHTPVVNGKYLFVVTTKNEVVCLARDTGIVIWIHRLPRFKNEVNRTDPIRVAGPLLVDHRLVMTSSTGEVYVLNAKTGLKEGTVFGVYPTMLPAIAAHQTIYILTDSGSLVALR